MIVETLKENLSVNKLVCSKKEIIFAEGDMIVPDSKPDILDTICTSGIICLYKKEVLDGKVRLDGNVNTYIMYLADDSKDRIRALNTSIDFSENIELPKSEQGMECKVNINLKSIEAKVVNGRKISIKATMEVEFRVYSREDIEIINGLAKMLGKTDIDGQVSEIRLTEKFIDTQIKEAESEKLKNEKLYKTLGATVGLAIVIVLI